MTIATINPATGESVRRFDALSDDALNAKVQSAADAFRRYRETPFAERARMLCRAAELFEAEKHDFGRLMVLEMGKPLAAAVQEAEKCAWACRYYAEHGERFLADELVETSATRSFVTYQPLGVILAIMPWNFPFWQVVRFAAPALMAGNVGLLKHASNVPQCALALEDVFRRAGFPDGAFQALLVGPERVEGLLDDPRIAAATLTGSVGAGSAVASAAGRRIKKTVLELGGSDPFVVMPSADLDRAVETAAKARTINNGQSCIAAKRFIVDASIAGEFTERLTRAMAALAVGDPMDERTDVGPLATREQLATVTQQVEALLAAKGRVHTGGRPLEGPGYFYPPTVITDVPVEAAAAREELFGPVALVFSARDIDDAIRIANATPFGLGSSAWTNDPAEQRRFIRELEAGLVFINGMVASDPRLPFGGVKASGYGRELGTHGIREFVNIKTVWIEGADSAGNRTATE